MRLRDYLLLAASLLALSAVVLTLALVGTPEVSGWVVTSARAALRSSAVGYLLVGTAILFLLSLIATAWDRSERCYEEDRARRAAIAAERYGSSPLLRTPTPGQDLTRLLFPGAPAGPLPDEWKASCGEIVRFPEHHTDRDPRVA